MLIGQYLSKVDAKGRVAFPKKLRQDLGDTLIMTVGYEQSLIVVSQSKWEGMMQQITQKPFTNASARGTSRFLFGNAYDVELDGQGRCIVPTHLREYCNLENEALFIGLGTYVELWSKRHWEVYQKKLHQSIEHIAEQLQE